MPLPGPGEAEDGDPRHVHQGALGGVPVAGAHRPGPPPAPRAPGPDRPDERGVDRHPHVAPHALRDRLRARTTRRSTTRRRRARRSTTRSRTSSRSRCRTARWHHVRLLRPRPRAHRPDTVELWQKVTTTEDPAWTRAVPLDATRREKAFGGPRRDHDHRRRGRRRGDRRRRRPPARRPAVRPRAVRREVPHARRGRAGRTTRSSGSSTSPSGCPTSAPTSSAGLTVVAPRRPARRRSAPRRDCSDALRDHHPGGQARRPARRARVRAAAAAARRVQPAVGAAHRGQGLRRRLRLRRRAVRRPGPARHRPDDRHRGHPARRPDRPDDRPAVDRRRRHRLRRAHERRAHRPGPRGRRAGRLPHRGPGQPQALRPPRRQGRGRRRHRAASASAPPSTAAATRTSWSSPAPTSARSTAWPPRSTGPRRWSTPAPTRSSPRR